MVYRFVVLLGICARCFFLAVIAVAFVGCDKKEKIPLVGDRVAFDVSDSEIETLPCEVTEPCRIGPEERSSVWAQPNRNNRNDIGNIVAPKKFSRTAKIQLGCGDGAGKILSSPVVSGRTLVIVGKDGRLYCHSLDSGEVIWSASLSVDESQCANGKEISGGGAVICGKCVYASSATGGAFCFDVRSGKKIWKTRLSAPARSAPLVLDDLVIVTNVNNQIEAMDLASGTIVWSHYGIVEDTNVQGLSVPVAVGGCVIAPYSSGEVVCVSAKSGEVVWANAGSLLRAFDGTTTALAHIKASPVAKDNCLYTVSYNGQTSCFDIRNGQLLWKRNIGGVETPSVSGNCLFLVSIDNALVCMNKNFGSVYWAKHLPFVKDVVSAWAGPVIAGGLLYVVGKNGVMLALDPAKKGTVVASYKLDAPVSLAPIVIDGKIFVIDEESFLYVFS
ncbi:PQQ-binding-like beta-propeller repeat protein [Candidatus Hydrogenosomobacter endosymbioticus]|uniref:Pyrrolo-quinoline quinone n=1 Tax=Candidatus Hydrogenosomobacter endosymbioticus TaxID=2558174 RepID=A0ABM7V9R3_9PROT|nr:PQQ-binding-like beta-propeller repeat protein [Candidatus Hydrogenosomobacter endosymbioticus]BDB96543.1 pyrrolo-quinoline quinone [Candidatus Hydrogenosomobacter endosymbioticus]